MAMIPSHGGHVVCCHGNGGLTKKFQYILLSKTYVTVRTLSQAWF